MKNSKFTIVEIFTVIITFFSIITYKTQNPMGKFMTGVLLMLLIVGAILRLKEAFFDEEKESN